MSVQVGPEYANHERYHESLNNLTPADVFYGRDTEILNQREIIKQNTLHAAGAGFHWWPLKEGALG